MEFILSILLIIVVWAMSKSTDWKYNNYMPPEGQMIDYNAQSLDRVKNHLTNEQIMKNTMSGKYNTKNFM